MVKNTKCSAYIFGLLLLINANFYLSAIDDLSYYPYSYSDDERDYVADDSCAAMRGSRRVRSDSYDDVSLFSSDDEEDCAKIKNKPVDFITELPDELGLEIMKYLTLRDLVKAGQVCKNWYRLARDKSFDTLWRNCILNRCAPLPYSASTAYDVEKVFMHAACSGILPVVRSLIDDCGCEAWGIALFCAAGNEHAHIVEFLINKQGIDVNQRSGFPLRTPLMVAARNGDAQVVRLLLSHPDAEANAVGGYSLRDYITAFELAVMAGHGDVVQILLDHPGIDASRYSDGCIWDHFTDKNFEAIKVLIAHFNSDVNQRFPGSDWTMLTRLIYDGRGSEPAVRFLLDHPDIDINQEGGHGITPLMAAVMVDDVSLVHMLLARQDVDVNKISNGKIVLICAVLRGNADIVRLLLNHPDIDIAKVDGMGRTALKCTKGKHEGIAAMIREHQKGLKKGCCVIS
jgi:ankyrin repeat protein